MMLYPPAARERGLILMPKLVPRVAAGHKTETRRLIRFPAATAQAHKERRIIPPRSMALRDGRWEASWPWPGDPTVPDFKRTIRCPFGVVGDRLYVRERHRFTAARSTRSASPTALKAGGARITITVEYSDGSERTIPLTFEQWQQMGRRATLNRPRPSIHMHRWASRHLLEIVGIAAERVQAIDEMAALDEGLEGCSVTAELNGQVGDYIVGGARDEFVEIWDGLHPKDPFASNPWVWVVKFKRLG